jgi:hypothetical protein
VMSATATIATMTTKPTFNVFILLLLLSQAV